MNQIAGLLHAIDPALEGTTRKCCFERNIAVLLCKFGYAIKHHSSGANIGAFYSGMAQVGSNLIGIDERVDTPAIGQDPSVRGGFTRAIGSRDQK